MMKTNDTKIMTAAEFKTGVEAKAAAIQAITDETELAEKKAQYEARLAKADALIAKASRTIHPDSLKIV